MHLTREAENNARFRADFADDPDVLDPALVPALCSDRVLTMEFVGGVHERDLEGSGIDVRAVVAAGMRGVCRMIFSHGFVHADLHPGNLRFLPPGRVVLLDLGLVGRLEDADRLDTARMLFAFATGDGATVARIFHRARRAPAPPTTPPTRPRSRRSWGVWCGAASGASSSPSRSGASSTSCAATASRRAAT